jgi:hypothetical protein
MENQENQVQGADEVRERMKADAEANKAEKVWVFDGSDWRGWLGDDSPEAYLERGKAICRYISDDAKMHEVANTLGEKPMALVRDIVKGSPVSCTTGGKKGDIVRRFVIGARDYNRGIRWDHAELVAKVLGVILGIGIDYEDGWVWDYDHAWRDNNWRGKLGNSKTDILACAVAEGLEDQVVALLECTKERKLHDLLGGDFNLRMKVKSKEMFPATQESNAVTQADYHGAIPMLIEKLREWGQIVMGLILKAVFGELVLAYNGLDELLFPETMRSGRIGLSKAVALDAARRSREVLARKGIDDRCLQEAVQYLEWLASGKAELYLYKE